MKITFNKFFVLLICIWGCSTNSDNNTAITIDSNIISIEQFFEYHDISSFSTHDQIQKGEIVDDFIKKTIIIQEAEKYDIPQKLNLLGGITNYYNPLVEELILEEKIWKPSLIEENLQKTYNNLNRTIALKHIVIQYKGCLRSKTNRSKEEALMLLQTIKQEIESGEISFSTAALKYSEDQTALESGNLGYNKWGSLFEPIQSVAFNLKLREISEPVKSRFGYHIVFVYAMKVIKIPPFVEYKLELEKFIRSRKGPEFNNALNSYEQYLQEKYDIQFNEEMIKNIYYEITNKFDAENLFTYMIKEIDINGEILSIKNKKLDIKWLKNEINMGSIISDIPIYKEDDLIINIEDILFRYLARIEAESFPNKLKQEIKNKSFDKYYESLLFALAKELNKNYEYVNSTAFIDSLMKQHSISIEKSLFAM